MMWVLYPVGLWVFLGLMGVAPMVILWFARYEPVEDDATHFETVQAWFEPGWIERAGFTPACVLKPLGSPLVFFLHQDQRTIMGVYLMQGTAYTDFVTVFPHDVGITTGNTTSSHTLPERASSMTQNFPGWDHDQRWQAHQDAVRLVETELRLPYEPIGPVELEFESAIRRQTRYVFKRPWLILTVPYRYFVTRFQRRGVSVTEQAERGWIDLEKIATRLREAEI